MAFSDIINQSHPPVVLQPSGEMAERVAAFDWASTPIGSRHNWPENLRVAVEMCLANHFPMHVWWGPDLVYLYNDAHIPLLGKRHPTALGQSARKIWSDVWGQLLPQVDAVMQRGESTWNKRANVIVERNGKPEDAWFTWCYSPIRDVSGRIAGLLCVATEDTQQVLSERERASFEEQQQRQRIEEKARDDEELRNSTILLRGISNSTGDIIFAKDINGCLRFANPATLALIGKPLEQVIGKTDAEFLENAEAAKAVMENDRRIISSGVAEDLEEIVPLPDGTHRVWFSQKMPYRDAQGKVIGLLGISRDITERKRVEEEFRNAKEMAEAASKAKDHLLAVVSHELRTPLNPILAIASYLQMRTDLPDEVREDINTIRRNVEQEARIVDDLLSLTRINRGKIVLHQEAVDLHAMVADALEQFAAQITEKQLEVHTTLAAEHHHMWADPVRMQQVLSNLLGNAVKFTPAQGRVVICSSIKNQIKLCLEITDTGVGIDPQVLPKLFSPFEQGEKTIARRFGGLGLGLVISKGILDLHKGTLTAASDGIDKGTTVTLELPVMRPALASAIPSVPASEDKKVPGLRVLLVEDHEDTLRIMRRVLTSRGYVVLTASSVKEALAKVEAETFDLLLSDIGLPDGSGLDIMRSVRQRSSVKGIAVSGFGHDEDIRRSREAGFTEHLVKPVDFGQLDNALRRVAG